MPSNDLIQAPKERWSLRRDTAAKQLLEALTQLIDASIAVAPAHADWVDQSTSPLGRRRHLELARKGALHSTRDGRRVLVRRADIEAYLARPRDEAQPNAGAVLHDMGFTMRRS